MRLMIMALAALTVSSGVHAATPAFDPRSFKGTQAGPPTEVLTLGTAHLSQMKTPPSAAMLAPLLNRLAAFRPTIITHEGISGEQCDTLKRYAATYPDMFETYCRGTEDAAHATGLDVPQATAAATAMFATWPRDPAPAQRRRLAALFLAAGDRPSATVQWLRLPAAERREGDGLDAALVKILARDGAKPNETFDIGVALAVRLGLDRLYAIDDHSADSIQAQAGAGFGGALQKHWSGIAFAEATEYQQLQDTMTSGADLLAFYRYANQPATQRAFIAADFGGALKQASPEAYGRQYVAWYETRNLRMVANIRAAFGNHPGARVLNIVGASHKGYFDAYLDMMHEVKLVDAETILR